MGLTIARLGPAAVILTRRSVNLMYNRVIGLGQDSRATPRQVEQAIGWAREHRTKRLGLDLGAAARPASLRGWLRALGFEQGTPCGKLWRGDSPLPRWPRDPDIRVKRVRPKEAALWVDVVSQVWRTFGYRRAWFEARVRHPEWRHYLAWADDVPVAAGALFVGSAGGRRVGHLVDGVTLGPWRRRGVQSAIIRRRIADGLSLGCELFTSETAPPLPRMPLVSFRNLRRQGFELAYLRESWSLDIH